MPIMARITKAQINVSRPTISIANNPDDSESGPSFMLLLMLKLGAIAEGGVKVGICWGDEVRWDPSKFGETGGGVGRAKVRFSGGYKQHLSDRSGK